MATITTVQPPGRYGALELSGNIVTDFMEKPKGDGGMINGGFFVLSPKCIDLIDDDETIWEEKPLKSLVENRQLMAFEHTGFWHPMDTLRDKLYLEKLWETGYAPWKKW
jgi:glucose-1-phosphate cytidylyltransferase